MAAVLILHAVVAVAAGVSARRLQAKAFLVAALAPLASVAWLVAQAGSVLDGGTVVQHIEWVPSMGVDIELRLDGMALLMAGLVSGIGVLVFAYAAWYFGPRADLGRLVANLVAFSGAMLGVVLADELFLLYVFWELTSITSYLLIGTEDERAPARAAALQAILVTGGGGLAMLAGFVLLSQAAGTSTLSAILADPPTGATVAPALALVAIGALTKSAQFPFHGWLPGAMAAPTPVSAYLHSATMVKAGVYLLARFSPAFAADHRLWRPAIVGIGVVTMLLGAVRALRQHDLKLLLAFGTVSQLGFMVALVGAGIPALTFAGAAVILAHAVFKAALFLVVGIVDHQAHTRDLRQLSGLWRRMPLTFAVAALATGSMAGLPPLAGFVAKEAAFEALLHDLGGWALVGIVAGSALTFAYGARFLWGAFATKDRIDRSARTPAETAAPAPAFVAPAVVLGVMALGMGLVPGVAGRIAGGAARSLDANVESTSLYLWHGFNTALALSAVVVVAGLLLFAARRQVEHAMSRPWIGPTAQGSYEASVAGLNRIADRTTGIVQNGSLPVYLGVILLTLLALPGWALLEGTSLPSDIWIAESPLQAFVAVLVVAAAVGTAVTRRRFAAVLCLGAVGFGVAVLFIVHGGPDLALTQLLVETLAVVVFVLVLRHLPERFESVRWRLGNGLRITLAVGVGLFVTSFALVAASSRTEAPVSEAHLALAEPEGGGRNVVNVILVDFRSLDTLGEITVLAVAGLGIASLVQARKDDEAAEEVDHARG
ncbi:MAG TPA: hydrogen gas-evolving membrane-bound hydrogenase subunit E [Acidimicrobiales bacterium]|nr:hydrogen gas-evolving membrane-bound hydrogenase subunit E [Acidimicrobiales bacterium]